MSSQHVLLANAENFAYCSRAGCANRGIPLAVQQMKLITFRNNPRPQFVCRPCYSHYQNRSLVETQSHETGIRGKFDCAADVMQNSNARLGIDPTALDTGDGISAGGPLFLPTPETVNVMPTHENAPASQGEDHRKRVHEGVSRGYRGSRS